MKNIYLLIINIFIVFPLISQNIKVGDLIYSHMGPIHRDAGKYGAPWGKHEGPLRGVPKIYDWENGARPGAWMSRGSNEAITAWGQIYEVAGDSPERNIRVQVRNFIAYAFVKERWIIMEQDSENLQAGWYAEDFTTRAGWAASRKEPENNGGGRSFEPKVDYNIHFWSSQWPRPNIPDDVQAYFLVCEARLIPNLDPKVDLSNAKYLLGVSHDYYTTNASSGHGPWPSLSVARLTYLSAEWKSFVSYIGGTIPTTEQMYKNDIIGRPLPPGVSYNKTLNAIKISANPTHISTFFLAGLSFIFFPVISTFSKTNETTNRTLYNIHIAKIYSQSGFRWLDHLFNYG